MRHSSREDRLVDILIAIGTAAGEQDKNGEPDALTIASSIGELASAVDNLAEQQRINAAGGCCTNTSPNQEE